MIDARSNGIRRNDEKPSELHRHSFLTCILLTIVPLMLAIVFALLPFPSIRTYGPLYQITLILLPALFSLGVLGKLYFAGKLPLISAIMLVAANFAISVVHFAVASAIAPT